MATQQQQANIDRLAAKRAGTYTPASPVAPAPAATNVPTAVAPTPIANTPVEKPKAYITDAMKQTDRYKALVAKGYTPEQLESAVA